MNIKLRISPHWLVDFRPLATHVNHDAIIERLWRARVARNRKEVARVAKERA